MVKIYDMRHYPFRHSFVCGHGADKRISRVIKIVILVGLAQLEQYTPSFFDDVELIGNLNSAISVCPAGFRCITELAPLSKLYGIYAETIVDD